MYCLIEISLHHAARIVIINKLVHNCFFPLVFGMQQLKWPLCDTGTYFGVWWVCLLHFKCRPCVHSLPWQCRWRVYCGVYLTSNLMFIKIDKLIMVCVEWRVSESLRLRVGHNVSYLSHRKWLDGPSLSCKRNKGSRRPRKMLWQGQSNYTQRSRLSRRTTGEVYEKSAMRCRQNGRRNGKKLQWAQTLFGVDWKGGAATARPIPTRVHGSRMKKKNLSWSIASILLHEAFHSTTRNSSSMPTVS